MRKIWIALLVMEPCLLPVEMQRIARKLVEQS